MNALAIPQSKNVTPLHPRLCVHCEKKPVYAPKAIYCSRACTQAAYRTRKRENHVTNTLQQRVEQLLSVIEQQSQQIAALTAIMQQQPTATTVTVGPTALHTPRNLSNVQPQRAADDLLPMTTAAPETSGGRNLLMQLLEATNTDYTTATYGKKHKALKPSSPHLVSNGSPKKLAAAQPLAAPSADDLATHVSL